MEKGKLTFLFCICYLFLYFSLIFHYRGRILFVFHFLAWLEKYNWLTYGFEDKQVMGEERNEAHVNRGDDT